MLIIFSLSEFMRHNVMLIYPSYLDWLNSPCNSQGSIKPPKAITWMLKNISYFGQWSWAVVSGKRVMNTVLDFISPSHWKIFKRKFVEIDTSKEVNFASVTCTLTFHS